MRLHRLRELAQHIHLNRRLAVPDRVRVLCAVRQGDVRGPQQVVAVVLVSTAAFAPSATIDSAQLFVDSFVGLKVRASRPGPATFAQSRDTFGALLPAVVAVASQQSRQPSYPVPGVHANVPMLKWMSADISLRW